MRIDPGDGGPAIWMMAVQQDGIDGHGLVWFRSDDSAKTFHYVAPIQNDWTERDTADLLQVGSDIALVYSYEGPTLTGSVRKDVHFQWWRYQPSTRTFKPDPPVLIFDSTEDDTAYSRAELAIDSTGRIWVQAFFMEPDGSSVADIAVSHDEGQTFQILDPLDHIARRGGGRLLSLGNELIFVYGMHTYPGDQTYPTHFRLHHDSAADDDWTPVTVAFPEGIYHGAALSAVATPEGGMDLVYKNELNEYLYFRYFDETSFGPPTLLDSANDWALQPAITLVGGDLYIFYNHRITLNADYDFRYRRLHDGEFSAPVVLDSQVNFKGYPAAVATLPTSVRGIPAFFSATANADATGNLTEVFAPDVTTLPRISLSTPEDTPLSVSIRVGDFAGDSLSYSVTTPPAHGALTGTPPDLTYTPSANYDGADFFTYQVNDGISEPTPGRVDLDVTAVDDAPVADAAHYTLKQDSSVSFDLTASDVEGDPLTFALASAPAHGKLLGTLPELTYVPDPGWVGSDGFTFIADDGQLESRPAAVELTVNPVDHPPIGASLTLSTLENTEVPVHLDATDPDGQPLTYSVVSLPEHGALSGTPPNLVYTPNSGWSGTDAFTYEASDGKLDSTVADVTLTVTHVNHAPVTPSFQVSTSENTAVGITLSGTDADEDALTYAVTQLPGHGALTGTPPDLTYHPDAHYTGTDELAFQASDGSSTSAPAEVTITVKQPIVRVAVSSGRTAVGCDATGAGGSAAGLVIALAVLCVAALPKRRM